MPIVETAQWKIKQKNHDEFLKLIVHGPDGDDSMGLAYQSKHPEIYHYYKTRTWSRQIEDSDEEAWFFVDEYNSMADYYESHKNYASQAEAIHKKKMTTLQAKLMLPGSLQGPFVWEEQRGTGFEFPEHINK